MVLLFYEKYHVEQRGISALEGPENSFTPSQVSLFMKGGEGKLANGLSWVLVTLTGTSSPSGKYQKVGEDRYVTKIVVSEMKMLGGNKTDGESHVAAPAPAASAANKGNSKTTKAGPKPELHI